MYYFLVNPASRSGKGLTLWENTICKALDKRKIPHTVRLSARPGDIEAWTRELTEKATSEAPVRIVLMGGDGTINDVVNGIMGFPNAQLAVIPCGSGNDFVKNFSNRKNFLDIEKQANGNPVDIDVIKMTTTDGNVNYAINMLNIGADCDIVVESQEMKRLPFVSGAGAYALAAVKIVPQNRLYRMRYEKDGQPFEEDVMLCAVANGQWCGGGFHNCPRASLDDGLMDVAIVYSCTGPILVKMLLKYHQGTHLEDKRADRYIKYFQVPSFRLAPVADVNVSIDGECSLFNETLFEVMPKAIKFAIPDGSEMVR